MGGWRLGILLAWGGGGGSAGSRATRWVVRAGAELWRQPPGLVGSVTPGCHPVSPRCQSSLQPAGALGPWGCCWPGREGPGVSGRGAWGCGCQAVVFQWGSRPWGSVGHQIIEYHWGTSLLGINGAPRHGASMGHQRRINGASMGRPFNPRPAPPNHRRDSRTQRVAPVPPHSSLRPASFPTLSPDWRQAQPQPLPSAYETAGESARPVSDWRRGRANGGAAGGAI